MYVGEAQLATNDLPVSQLIPAVQLLCTGKSRLTGMSSRANFPGARNKTLSLHGIAGSLSGLIALTSIFFYCLVNLESPRSLLSKLLNNFHIGVRSYGTYLSLTGLLHSA